VICFSVAHNMHLHQSLWHSVWGKRKWLYKSYALAVSKLQYNKSVKKFLVVWISWHVVKCTIIVFKERVRGSMPFDCSKNLITHLFIYCINSNTHNAKPPNHARLTWWRHSVILNEYITKWWFVKMWGAILHHESSAIIKISMRFLWIFTHFSAA
jgi:hypothetical protein